MRSLDVGGIRRSHKTEPAANYVHSLIPALVCSSRKIIFSGNYSAFPFPSNLIIYPGSAAASRVTSLLELIDGSCSMNSSRVELEHARVTFLLW